MLFTRARDEKVGIGVSNSQPRAESTRNGATTASNNQTTYSLILFALQTDTSSTSIVVTDSNLGKISCDLG